MTVKVPPAKAGSPKYFFTELQVGGEPKTFKIKKPIDYQRVKNAACLTGQRHGMKFTTRKIGKEVHVYRLK